MMVTSTTITILMITFVIGFYYPIRDTQQYVRLQEKLISDVQGLSHHSISVHQMMKSTIQEYPTVTNLAVNNGNVDDFYHLFNDIIVYNYLNGRDNSTFILRDIKTSINRLLYTKDIAVINTWSMTN